MSTLPKTEMIERSWGSISLEQRLVSSDEKAAKTESRENPLNIIAAKYFIHKTRKRRVIGVDAFADLGLGHLWTGPNAIEPRTSAVAM
jgi:hypothetical protein